MSEDNTGNTQLALRKNLAKFKTSLSDKQKTLLDTVLKLAQEITAEGDALDLGFDDSFSPDDKSLILLYADSPAMIQGLIKGTLGTIRGHSGT